LNNLRKYFFIPNLMLLCLGIKGLTKIERHKSHELGGAGMKIHKLLLGGVILVLALAFGTAGGQATLITSLPDGTIMPMPGINYRGVGPQTVGPGITWSSTIVASDFGKTDWYGFGGSGSNGGWDGSLGPMAGLENFTGTMTFEFSNPVAGVGGFLNYISLQDPCTIAVYDISNNLIESYTLTFHTDGGTNTGFFFGFLEGSSNIKYFKLTNNWIGVTTLTVQENAAPLPGAVWLLGSGLLSLGAVGWRRRQRS
jgi:hypothetical protein